VSAGTQLAVLGVVAVVAAWGLTELSRWWRRAGEFVDDLAVPYAPVDPAWVMSESQHLFDTTARDVPQSDEVSGEQLARIELRLSLLGGFNDDEARDLLAGDWETDR
jgi:hypothetical protein